MKYFYVKYRCTIANEWYTHGHGGGPEDREMLFDYKMANWSQILPMLTKTKRYNTIQYNVQTTKSYLNSL